MSDKYEDDDGNDVMTDLSLTARARLKNIVARIESLNADAEAISEDLKVVRTEAKAEGFDVKTINTVVRRRKADRAKLAEADSLVELYEGALED